MVTRSAAEPSSFPRLRITLATMNAATTIMTPSDRADAAHTPWMPSPATFGRISTSGTNRATGRANVRIAALPPCPSACKSVMPMTMGPATR